ncbi:SUKH-3 domain-containing protein [Micromonospora cathayae]|uniref:SUKH-3 domain-containing protein n=1 Tax=Micromonospora cathayae TaxID=3028804 RepID=A0ABY7ZHB2_9ACTN|nr:SUKH-3 domain-containing protein [Micromonospora sp. HUAS 3]WDZ82260.1 SUKH-3 domain-containing protein [Micromonospora sp. HUAS 3]
MANQVALAVVVVDYLKISESGDLMIRFDSLSQDTLRALDAAGWGVNRAVDPKQWVEPLESEGYRVHPLATAVLSALGGLSVEPINRVGPNFANDEPYNFDPLAGGSGQRALALEVETVLGGQYFPIGEWLSYSSVFLEARGRVVAAGMGWFWEVGPSFEESLELAVCANRPLLCLYSDPGVAPWPPA